MEAKQNHINIINRKEEGGDGYGVERSGYTSYGKEIKKKLIDRDMTARQLADLLGTTPQYLNRIFHGERSGEKYKEAIRKILDIPA